MARVGGVPRWRDVQCVEFEPEAPQETPPAIGGGGERHGASVPERDPGPRYGRAIAPLPRHLIASVPAQQRVSGSPAPVRRSASTSGIGTRAVLRGTPFPGRARRGGRRFSWVAIAVIGAAFGVVIYHGDQIFAGLAQMPPHPVSATPLTAEITQTTAMPMPPLVGEASAAASVTKLLAPAAKPAAAATLAAVSAASSLQATPLPAPPPKTSERIDRLQTRAKSGDATAQYTLAVFYARGQGVPRDYRVAASWFREAAIAGNAAAQYNLGVLYERG
ncbi:MAG: tetratricopeptide repeat protein, partial [Stellaceae bacterium]